MTGKPVPAPWGKQLVHKKVRYSEYTDDDSFKKKPQPAWLGNLGRSSPAENRGGMGSRRGALLSLFDFVHCRHARFYVLSNVTMIHPQTCIVRGHVNALHGCR